MEKSIQEESITTPWLMQEGEPSLWFNRFLKYYLPLGAGRTLTQAYLFYLKEENPELAAAKEESGRYINTTRSWSENARIWHWRERAEAFDRFSALDFARTVAQARNKILENSLAAAEALVSNLTNPRTGVQAAKEILDRAGIPSTHIIGHANLTPYTADDFNQAEKEVKEWEEQLRDKVIDGESRDPEPGPADAADGGADQG